MRTRRFLFTAAILIVLVAAVVYANYDKVKIVAVMQEARGLLATTRTAIGAGDFAKAEESFNRYVEIFTSIRDFTPNKGTKTEWDRVIGTFIETAKTGASASAVKNAAEANKSLEGLLALNREGHSKFR